MNQFVLMADVIKSGDKVPNDLMTHFKEVVKNVNMRYGEYILSPLTITLGDEFQGICTSLLGSVEVIIGVEEEIIHQNADFRLRYVLVEGEVSTPINTEIAYEMLGEGLTNARKILERSKKLLSKKFHFDIMDERKDEMLDELFFLMKHFINGWHGKDIQMVSQFLRGKNYKEIAKELGKHETSVWRKESSLAIDEYKTCKSLIRKIVSE